MRPRRVAAPCPREEPMTGPKDADFVVTLELSGDAVDSGGFPRIVAAFDDLLKAVAKAACGDEAGVQWMVRPKAGNRLAAAPAGDADGAGVEKCRALMARILDGRAEPGECDDAVRPIGVLARGKGVHLRVGRKRMPITDGLRSRLKASTQNPCQLHGTVEGRLAVLDERRGLEIEEPVWGRRIVCSVPVGKLEDMRALWRKRVTAEGIVHYDHEGYPVKIEAEKVEPFPDDEDLPSLEDVRGILRAA